MSKKLTYDFVKDRLEKEGYILLTEEYINSSQKLNYICPKGHRHSISFSKWLSGRRCYYCNGKIKLTTEFVRQRLKEVGYELLSEYKNSSSKLKYKCSNNHFGEMKWDHFRDGHRCPRCVGNKKLTYKFVKEQFEKEGYELLSKEYINTHSKLKYRCPKGHVGYIQYYNWVIGHRCAECAGVAKKSIPFIKQEMAKDGYILKTACYENCNQKLHLICPNGHDYFVTWDNWNHSGSRCPKCKKWGTSVQELEIVKFIKDVGFEVLEHDRSLIHPYELDIVIPAKKIAIEYCGLYWHSELAGKVRKYHLNKLDLCEREGYKLITIFEDEFVNNKDIVFSRLKNILNINNGVIKIFARNCNIKEIGLDKSANFCNLYHLQGYHGSNIKLGAFYNNELVSVMTFSKPSVSKGFNNYKEGVWELSRFCSKINYHIVGIASKLLKHFERNYEYNEIFSYADRRWSVGNLYEKLGFNFIKKTQPNYWYLKGQNRVHRFALRKTKDDPQDQTEWEIRKSQGHNRIWDCGNLKYEKINISI